MDAHPVDPRDTQWEVDVPTYRVYFFTRPESGGGWASSEFQLVDARDVREVLSWAESNSQGRTYIVYAVVDRAADAKGLLTLVGHDPNRPDDPRKPNGG